MIRYIILLHCIGLAFAQPKPTEKHTAILVFTILFSSYCDLMKILKEKNNRRSRDANSVFYNHYFKG
jgi:hypothetical protein